MNFFDEDFNNLVKEIFKAFDKDNSFSSFSIKSSYKAPPGYGNEGEDSGGADSERSKKNYTFKDFNIRYHFHPANTELCYLNFTNVPPKEKINRIYLLEEITPTSKKVKICIQLSTSKKIIDKLDLPENHNFQFLKSYFFEQKEVRKVLILKFSLN